MKIKGTYAIKNLANGKTYIGCSTDVKRRLTQHKSYLRANTHLNPQSVVPMYLKV